MEEVKGHSEATLTDLGGSYEDDEAVARTTEQP